MEWEMRVWGRRTLLVAALVPGLFAYACGESAGSSDDGGAGGSSVGGGGSDSAGAAGENEGGSANGGAGGSANGGAGGATTSGSGTGGGSGGTGLTGAGGEAGAADGFSTGGSAGASGVTCIPAAPPDTSCEYPESLGGGSDSEACGVTPGAWFGISDSSELTAWPERATVSSPTDGIFGSFRKKFGRPQVAFDPEGRPVLAYQEQDPAGAYVLSIVRWDGSEWGQVVTRPMDAAPAEELDLLVDSSGRPLLLARRLGIAGVELTRFADSAWKLLGRWLKAEDASVVLDADDRPTITYYDFGGDPQRGVVAERRTGSTWEDLGKPEPDLTGTEPVLALRANGDAVVAYYLGSSIMLRQWTGSSWDELGGSGSGAGLGDEPEHSDEFRHEDHQIALAVDASDRVVIAWGGNYRVWNGSEWSALAPVGGSRPRLAQNADGALYLLTESGLSDTESVQERLLFHWTNDAWEPLPSTTAEYTEAVDLAVAPDGTVGTAFGYRQALYRTYAEGEWTQLDTPASPDIGVDLASYPGVPEVPPVLHVPEFDDCSLSQWNGTTWEVLPAPADARWCAFERNSDDAYLAFWTEGDWDQFHLRVARQTDNGWEVVGDAVTDWLYVDPPTTQIAIDSHGRPVVAWLHHHEEYRDAHVMGWDGSSWTEWGDSTFVPLPDRYLVRQQLMLTGDDRPVLAAIDYSTQRLHVSEWTGEDWRQSEFMSPDDEDWYGYRLAIDATGALVISRPGQSSLELLRWSGSDWEPLTATDDVLAGLPPSVRVDAATDSGETLFRYFEDCAWRGLSASDSGGGVSNSTATSSSSRVSATEHSVCVAWSDTEDEVTNVLMRCHEW